MTPWQAYEISLLALTLYREARGESYEAKIAVAHTVKNRLDHPGWWGNDKQLTTWPKAEDVLIRHEGIRGWV